MPLGTAVPARDSRSWSVDEDTSGAWQGSAIERRRDSLPERLRPRLSVSAGHGYVPMPEDHLHPVQRHPVVQKSRGACIAQSVLQSVSASFFDASADGGTVEDLTDIPNSP